MLFPNYLHLFYSLMFKKQLPDNKSKDFDTEHVALGLVVNISGTNLKWPIRYPITAER